MVAFQSAHRPEPSLQPAMVTLDAVVRVPLRVVKRGRYETFDHSPQRRGPIGHDLDRISMRPERRREKPATFT